MLHKINSIDIKFNIVLKTIKTNEFFTVDRLRNKLINSIYYKHDLSKYLNDLYTNDYLDRIDAKTVLFKDRIIYKCKYAYRIKSIYLIDNLQLKLDYVL